MPIGRSLSRLDCYLRRWTRMFSFTNTDITEGWDELVYRLNDQRLMQWLKSKVTFSWLPLSITAAAKWQQQQQQRSDFLIKCLHLGGTAVFGPCTAWKFGSFISCWLQRYFIWYCTAKGCEYHLHAHNEWMWCGVYDSERESWSCNFGDWFHLRIHQSILVPITCWSFQVCCIDPKIEFLAPESASRIHKYDGFDSVQVSELTQRSHTSNQRVSADSDTTTSHSESHSAQVLRFHAYLEWFIRMLALMTWTQCRKKKSSKQQVYREESSNYKRRTQKAWSHCLHFLTRSDWSWIDVVFVVLADVDYGVKA